MVLQYTVCDFELPNPENFPYPSFLQEFIHNLIPGLPYPGKFPYHVKISICKSVYLLERNNNQKQKLSGLNDSWYVPPHFMM